MEKLNCVASYTTLQICGSAHEITCTFTAITMSTFMFNFKGSEIEDKLEIMKEAFPFKTEGEIRTAMQLSHRDVDTAAQCLLRGTFDSHYGFWVVRFIPYM